MPFYESLEEVKVIVIEIGTAYTKCGLAGETKPRCIIPSETINTRTSQVVNVWNYQSLPELYENLKSLIHTLIFRHLLITPKDRRVVVIESLLCPSDFRHTLAQVLYKHFEVGSVLFGSGHLLSLLTLGCNNGLVLDVGYKEAVAVPIFEGIPIMKALQSIPFASKAIHSRIKSQLLENGSVSTSAAKQQPVSEVTDSITEKVLEDIKVRCCFVTSYERAQQIHDVSMRGGPVDKLPAPPPGTDYHLNGNCTLHIPGSIREHSGEVLFEQDNEETSVATLLLESLVQCPLDTRKAMANNVLIIGGTSLLPGFHHRLQVELANLLKKPVYSNQLGIKVFKFHKTLSKENYTAWLGGALLGALGTLPAKSLSRDAYLQKGKLPDWCCID